MPTQHTAEKDTHCKGCGAPVTHEVVYQSGATWQACAHCAPLDAAARHNSVRVGLTDDDAVTVRPIPPGSCGCPVSGFGYRHHRHPCPRAGENESVIPPGAETDQSDTEQHTTSVLPPATD